MTQTSDNASQDYIDLIVQAWRELQEIDPRAVAAFEEWQIKWALRNVTPGDRRAMIENWKKGDKSGKA